MTCRYCDPSTPELCFFHELTWAERLNLNLKTWLVWARRYLNH